MKQLSQVSLKKNDRQAIEEAVAILRKKFPVEEIRLFGSKARGDDDEESDIDLLVLISKAISREERYQMTDALYDLQLKYAVVFSLVVVPSKKWKEGIYTVLPIHQEIEEQGVAA